MGAKTEKSLKRLGARMVRQWNVGLGRPLCVLASSPNLWDDEIKQHRAKWWCCAEWRVNGVMVSLSESRVFQRGSEFTAYVRVDEMDECVFEADSAHEALRSAVAAAREACADADVGADELDGVSAMVKGVG
jgi:hypothetical protein